MADLRHGHVIRLDLGHFGMGEIRLEKWLFYLLISNTFLQKDTGL